MATEPIEDDHLEIALAGPSKPGKGCEIAGRTALLLRDYNYEKVNDYGKDADKFIRERTGLENESMPAPQPARQPLVGVILPGEHSDIRIDVKELLANGEEWLATPNTNYAGRRPLDLIDTPDELLLRETLRSVIYSGMA